MTSAIWTGRWRRRRHRSFRLSPGLGVFQISLFGGVQTLVQALNFSVSAGNSLFETRVIGPQLFQLLFDARLLILELLASLLTQFFRTRGSIAGHGTLDVLRFHRVTYFFDPGLQVGLLSFHVPQLFPKRRRALLCS